MKSQGWSPFILDTNGNGKRDAYVEANQPVDAAKDKRIVINLYAVAVSPSDGAIWGTVLGYPGGIVRVAPGDDPTQHRTDGILSAAGRRDLVRAAAMWTADGVYWVALSSGHVGSFDRRKCKVLNGPTATGTHCPEGWTLIQLPGPQFRTVTDPGSAEVQLLRLGRLVRHVRARP